MNKSPDEINIVTLNCWGLKFISKLRRERLAEIGRQLAIASPKPHIVALQECWTQEDYQSIRSQTRLILPYGKFYHSAALGSGLAILSRWPIEESTMYRYPLNGRPTAFWRGDWYVGKGVASARIRYGAAAKQVIEVFNTHTHAPYEGGKPDDSYLCHRTAQSWEMAKLLRGAAERGHLVLAVGDFNMIPMSLEHQLITTLAPVRDVWRVLHPDSSVGPAHHPAEKARRRPVPSAEFNIQENGAASDGPYNTWRWSKAQQKLLGLGKPPVTVPPDTSDPRGKRLDYVFASSGDIQALGGGWVVKRANVGMMMPHPKLGCSLSDHFSVEATLVFQPTSSTAPSPRPSTAQVKVNNGTYLHLSSLPSSSTHLPASPPSPTTQLASFLPPLATKEPLPPSSYAQILALIATYRTREQNQIYWRARHFFMSIIITIACLIGVWFLPAQHNYIAFILMMISSLGLAAGVVDGLLALLFFKSELKALKEFEWEVRNGKGEGVGRES